MSRPQKSTGNHDLKKWFKPKPSAPLPAVTAPGVKGSTSDSRKRPRMESIESSNKRQQTPPSTNSLPSPTPSASHNNTMDIDDDLEKAVNVPTKSTSASNSVSIGATSKSFTAGSSFSSTARSSQPSKRVMRCGEEVVRGSDSETDGSGSPLEDLGMLLKTSKPKPKPPPTTTLATSKSTSTTATKEQNSTISFSTWKKNAEKKKAAAALKRPPEKKYAFDIDTLVRENQRKTAIEVRIADAQAKLNEASESARMESLQRTPKKETIKAALIETNDTEDDGRARRVMEALVRTEAFERNEVWRFFTSTADIPRTTFPKMVHENKLLATVLNDPARREQAFLSGYLQRISNSTTLPDELMLWMMDEICREPREKLISAYVETLSAAVDTQSSCLLPEGLQSRFERLGATTETASRKAVMAPTRETAHMVKHPIKPNVLYFVDLLRRLHAKLPQRSKDVAVNLLVRMIIDHSVLSNADLSNRIQDALTNLLSSYPAGPEMDHAHLRISKTIFKTLTSPLLRNQLIAALPRSELVTHHFRRRLALSFVLDNMKFLNEPLDNPVLTSRIIISFAKNPSFRVTNETDYLEFRARLSMLDVALDSGFTNFSFLEEEKKEAEKKFNDEIDHLTTALRDMMAKIVDAGAAHMRRTEAKAQAERLASRLEFAVRTKEKPPRDWFGQKEREQESRLMKNWVKGEESVLSEVEDTKMKEDAVGGATRMMVTTPIRSKKKEKIVMMKL